MIACPCAGDVKEVAFGVIDLLQVRVVAYRLNSFLQGNDLVVAGHHGHSSEFQSFGKMHRTDRDVAAGGLDVLIENLEGNSRRLNGSAGMVNLRRGTDENA